jgi:hypothetical protein
MDTPYTQGFRAGMEWQKRAEKEEQMSDLQDLIHKTSMDCIERGKVIEQERILTQWQYEMNECKCEDAMGHMERRIKGETK